MKTLVARAALCFVVCSSLTGCGTAGQIAGGLLAATAAKVLTEAVASAIGSAARGDRSQTASTPVAAWPPSYPGDEDPALLTCEAKRSEFLSVYHSTRRLPPQLACSADGAFADPVVYGASSRRIAEATAARTPE